MIFTHIKNLLRDELADVLPEIKDKINKKLTEYEPNKIYSFGNKNSDKTFYIINRKMPGGGLFSNVTFVLNELKICVNKNFIPVIDMQNFPVIYNDLKPMHGSDNSWEYYFEQPTTYNLEDAYNSNKVIFSDNEFKIDKAQLKKYVLELDSPDLLDIKHYLKPKKIFTDEAHNFFNKTFKSTDKVLGVHFRGTNYKTCPRHAFCLTPRLMIENINYLVKKFGYNKIFLCTEETVFLKKLKKYYGEKISFVDTYRVNINIFSSHVPAFNNYPRENHRYLLGRESLMESLILSKCQGLTYVKTNVISAAKVFSKIKQNDHPVNIGFNSNNRFISRWLWYFKNLLPVNLGGFKKITYE
jgi:hypothetical protein|tara:strand:- start:117 stop:1181 length:1065 start_codon:yes stop_codon:yes gene_type:complete